MPQGWMEKSVRTTGGASLDAFLKYRKASVSDDELVHSYIEAYIRESCDFRNQYWVPTWVRDILFYSGFQNLRYDEPTRRWHPTDLEDEAVRGARAVINRIRAMVLTQQAMLLGFRPDLVVRPADDSPTALTQTRTMENIIDDLERESDYQTESAIELFWRVVCGGGWRKTYYDPEYRVVPVWANGESAAGMLYDDHGEPIPAFDGRGRQEFDMKDIGSVRLAEARSCFEMHPPPSHMKPTVAGMRHIAERRVVPIAELVRVFGDKARKVKADRNAVDHAVTLGLDFGRMFTGGSWRHSEETEAVWVTEYHHVASKIKGFEEGRKVIIAGDQTLYNGPGEIPGGLLPYDYFPLTINGWTMHGSSLVDDAINPQRQFNAATRFIQIAMSQSAYPRYVFEGWAVDRDQLTAGHRAIELKPGGTFGVREIESRGFTPAVATGHGLARQDLEDTFSVFGPSRGNLPGASPQPVGTIQRLQAADINDLKPGAIVCAKAAARQADLALRLVGKYYTTERVAFSLDSQDDPGAVFRYSAADIMSPDRYRIIVEEKPEQADKLALQQMMAEIAKSGVLAPLFQDPTFLGKFLEFFNFPVGDFTALGAGARAQQQREIARMLDGEKVVVEPHHKHPDHMRSLDDFMEGAQWERMSDAERAPFLEHYQGHFQAMQEQSGLFMTVLGTLPPEGKQAFLQQAAQALMQLQQQATAGGGPGVDNLGAAPQVG